jgi:hypothetical protein
MTPKQKASNLYDRMTVDFSIDKWQTKQCALIAVDEIETLLMHERIFESFDYWKEVKQELELL